jgi:hypothetical protein
VTSIPEEVRRALGALRDGIDTAWRTASFWGPVRTLPSPFHTVAALGSLLALVATTGVVLTSLAVLLASLLFLYLLLAQVFGLEIELR